MKYSTRLVASLPLACGILLLLTSTAEAQFQQAAKWVPNDANMLVLVRSGEIFESKIAKEQDWKRQRQKAFDAGVSKIPPAVERFLISSQLDLQFMEPIWQVAVFESENAVDLVKVSEEIGGSLDTIEERQAIALPNDAYLVKVNNNTIASMAPANRQMATRWIGRRRSSQMRLSDYLTSSVKFTDKNAHIIAAIDFEHSIRPEDIRDRIRDSSVVSEDEVDDICNLLAGMKGVTLGVTISDTIDGAIKVDFNNGSSLLEAKGKEVLFEALKDHGLYIEDLNNWRSSVSESQLILRGSFSPTGLRKVGMLIEQPLF